MNKLHTQRDLRIALFHNGMKQPAGLVARLTAMGHHAVVCNEVADLSDMLERGDHFDLLLIPAQTNLVSKLLLMGAEVLSIPTLFLIHQQQWEDLPLWSKSFPRCDALSFDTHQTTEEELHWRLHAVLSRQSPVLTPSAQPALGRGSVWGDYRFLERRRAVLHRGREVTLQPRQFELALQLFKNVGRVLTREWLRGSVWHGKQQGEDSRVLDVCAANLRRKLELCDENGFVLKAVYKSGYCLFEVNPASAGPGTWNSRTHGAEFGA